MAQKKDNVTRNLVIGMISLVVVVGVAVSFGRDFELFSLVIGVDFGLG